MLKMNFTYYKYSALFQLFSKKLFLLIFAFKNFFYFSEFMNFFLLFTYILISKLYRISCATSSIIFKSSVVLFGCIYIIMSKNICHQINIASFAI